jgi:hypothetical protein
LIGENENREIINNTPLLNTSQSGTNSLNQIFKKILLENNSMSSTKINKPTSILCNTITGKAGDAAANSNFSNHRTRVLICSDATEESEISFDQKLLFLMKRQNIFVDSVTIGDSDIIIVRIFQIYSS